MKIKSLKRKAWIAFSKQVRTGATNCYACGTPVTFETCDASHYQANSERNMSLGGNELWYDKRQIQPCCLKCNRFMSGNLQPFALHLIRDYGQGILEDIQKKYRTYKLWTVAEIQAIIDCNTE